MKKNIFALIMLFTSILNAQETIKDSWNMVLHFNAGYAFSISDWEYTHPIFMSNGSMFTGRIKVSFEGNAEYSGGFEFSNSNFGFQANIGFYPSKILIKEQIDPGLTTKRNDVFSFNMIFLGIEGIYYPLSSSTDRITPFLKLGVSRMTTTGDIQKNALSLCISAGSRAFITERFGISLTLKARYMNLFHIPVSNTIIGDFGLTSLLAAVGIQYVI